jgi:histone acetyltransferase (RNA polymerase elongator complex component)
MDDEVLRLSGRGHTAADTINAVRLLREHGFSVGLQVMPGLPGDRAERFRGTVRRVIALKPDLVRIYPALVIRDTPLAELYRAGRYAPLALGDAVAWCREALDRFDEAGIEVVRVGLQPTAELERPGTVVAGPWHPAFRQLVESSRLLESMRSLLAADTSPEPVTFAVHPADLSSAIGQNRMNIHAIRDLCGRDAKIIADTAIPRGAVRIATDCIGRAEGI